MPPIVVPSRAGLVAFVIAVALVLIAATAAVIQYPAYAG
jgi:hypothetical protein